MLALMAGSVFATAINELKTSAAITAGQSIRANSGLTAFECFTPSESTHNHDSTYVAKSLFDANSIIYATFDNTPLALPLTASTIVGRKATGVIAALTGSDVRTICGLATTDSPTFAAMYLGGSLLCNGDGFQTNDTIVFKPGAISTKYITFQNSGTYPEISASGTGADLLITAAGGNVRFDNENLITTGTLGAGAITGTSFSGPLTGNVTGNVSGSSGSCTGNAATVTTNANLTGPITSTGNATSIASQTGTGTKFVVDTSPTLVTPTLGEATATSINKVAITPPTTTATLAISEANTLNCTSTSYVSQDYRTTGTPQFAGLGLSTGASTAYKLNIQDAAWAPADDAVVGIFSIPVVTHQDKTNVYGLQFQSYWKPTLTADKTAITLIGCFGGAYAENISNSYFVYITGSVTGFWGGANLIKTGSAALYAANTYGFRSVGTVVNGGTVITANYQVYAGTPTISNGGTIPTSYGFYEAGQAVAGVTTGWGLAINTQSYINGNLRVGSAVAPTAALDVTGAGLFSSTVTSTQFKLSALNTAPANAADTGTLGEIRVDASYIYICTATNTWKRAAIATW